MKRIFIQAYCKYPRGGALANYIENFTKAISHAGYSVIFISDKNNEYDVLDKYHYKHFESVYTIKISNDEKEAMLQKKEGFAKERLAPLKEKFINSNDVVIVIGIMNKFMLQKLFEYRSQIGFKIICGVFEMFALEDFESSEKYEQMNYIKGELYLKADAILSISEYIDNYYYLRGMPTYRFPPLIDVTESYEGKKKTEIYKYIIPSSKDSFTNILKAFSEIDKQELNKMELHICNSDEEHLQKYISESEWYKIKDILKIHKWLKYEELTELYKQMNFLLIARNECQRTLANFPSKVPECMNLGIVPIVSDVGDYTKYYLEDSKNSIFIEGDSIKEIKKAIKKTEALSKEEYEKYSYNARVIAANRFDYRNWVYKIRKMIESV